MDNDEKVKKVEPAGSPPQVRKWCRRPVFLLLATLLGVVLVGGGAVVHALGGFPVVRAVYLAWKDPGSQAFASKSPVPLVQASSTPSPQASTGVQGAVLNTSPSPMAVQVFDNHDRLNLLCLGVDYNHDERGILYTKNARTDTMFMVSLDRKAEGLRILSIPRDLRVEIPGRGFDKANAAYAYAPEGALQLTVQTVEKLLGIHIDHTVVIKPYAAEHLIEALGGIDIEVEKDMDYDDNWGHLHIHLKKGMQHLTGIQAVGYVRFRKDDEGDRGRMRRQQQMVSALVTQLKRIETLARISDLKSTFQRDIQTSLGYEQLIDLAMLYKGFDRAKMQAATLTGRDTSIDDSFCIIPDDAQKQRVVKALFLGEGPPSMKPADVRVEVLNGSPTAGAASRVARLLRQQGYNVINVGDTYPTSRTAVLDQLYNKVTFKEITRIVSLAGVTPEPRPLGPVVARDDADVTVVIGADFPKQAAGTDPSPDLGGSPAR